MSGLKRYYSGWTILQHQTQVLRIPSEALFDNNRVLVLNSDGQLQQRQLKTGISNWHFTEVIDGLNAGEQVVTSIEREGVKAGAYATIEPQHDWPDKHSSRL